MAPSRWLSSPFSRAVTQATLPPFVEGRDAVVSLDVCCDISVRRKAEEARREAEALRAVAELARPTAHEITNPLAGAPMSVERLKTRDAAERRPTPRLPLTHGRLFE